jgi:hypothetical protein
MRLMDRLLALHCDVEQMKACRGSSCRSMWS